jgi:hypothetical protein
VIVRRERPHPGAQLDLIEQADGYRYTALATDTHIGQHTFLDARHLSVAGAPGQVHVRDRFPWFLDACVRRRPAGGVKVERPRGRTTLTPARSSAGWRRARIIPAGSAGAPAYLGPRTVVGSAT